MFYYFLVTVNVVIILYLIYAVATVLFDLAEEEKHLKKRYKCKVPKIVPNQKSAKEALFNIFK